MGFVQRRLVKLVLWVVAWPKVTVGLCALGLAGSVFLAMTRLGLSTDHNELMTPQLAFFRDYLDFIHKFPENECFEVMVLPKEPDRPPPAKRWMELADKLAAGLRGLENEVRRVEFRVTPQEAGDQGVLLDDWDDVRKETGEMKRMMPLLRIVGQKPELFKQIVDGQLPMPDETVFGTNMTERLVTALGKDKPEESKGFVELVAGSLDAALARPAGEWKKGAEIPDLESLNPLAGTDPRRAGYFVEKDRTSPGHKVLLINVYEKRDFSKLSDVSAPLKRMREVVERIAKDYADFHVGVTGRPAMEADEMIKSDWDMKIAEVLGLSLVFVVLLIFLRSLWLVIAAELCLGVGIGWTFGWATVSIGRLNLLSLVFVIALIGIGMDYLIQVLTRYRYEKKRYKRHGAIWARVFRFVSPPISTACAGAAGAFLVSRLTDFRGAAELGVIAGGGLLLCLLAGYTLLPALLTLFPVEVGKVAEEDRYSHRQAPPKAGGWRMIVPAVWVLVAVGGLCIAKPEFNPNLIELQAQGLDSVQLIRKVSAWSAVIMSEDLGKLRKLRVAVTPGKGEKSAISHTESVLDMYDKQKWLWEEMKSVEGIAWREPPDAQMEDGRAALAALEKVTADWGKKGVDVAELQKHVASLAEKLPVEKVKAETLIRLTAWQRAMLGEMMASALMFHPPEVRVDRLPAAVRDHLVSGMDTPGSKPVYVLYIYPSEDAWDARTLETFVDEVERRVLAGTVVTGIGPQLNGSTKAIHKAFEQSTWYALGLIFVLVWLDLRKFGQTFLAVSVLGLGLPMLLLVMWGWRMLGNPLGISGTWNFANFFGLPILIGAGHEYGVFMVHRYREVLHDPKRVWRTWDVSDRALLLCAIVTTCSFGFLMIADHRGLRSLGWVMAMGSACIYLSSLLVLRPILQWRLRQKDVYSSR